jgi:putative ABC transport system substrate-binding protein
MRRREFITLIGGAAAWPLAVRAQQTRRPIIGFLGSSSSGPDNITRIIEHLRRGLGDAGFVEGHNVVVEYRWAEGHYDRLPALAAELVRHPVAVLVAGGITAAVAAKGATTTIPIVFYTGGDPVKLGLVGNLNKPDGNVTGAVYWGKQLVAKQFELMHDLMPKAHAIAFLVNPRNASTDDETNEMEVAASALGQKLIVLRAISEDDLAGAFATIVRERAGALILQGDPFLQYSARAAGTAVGATWNCDGVLAARLGPASPKRFAWWASTRVAFSRAKDQPICQSSRAPRSSLSSTSAPRRRSASISRPRCSPAPTR